MNDFIKSVTVIPSRKDSIFEEEYSENEIFNIEVNYDEWLNHMKNYISEQKALQDYGVKYSLNNELLDFVRNAKGFMLGPIGKLGNKILLAKSVKANSLEELSEKIKIEDVYVYTIYENISQIVVLPNDKNISSLMTFEEIEKAERKEIKFIIFRYGVEIDD